MRRALLIVLVLTGCPPATPEPPPPGDDDDDTTSPPAPAITASVDVATQPLARTVRVHLVEEGPAQLDCSAEGDAHRVVSDDPATEHALQVTGLLPETTYVCVARSGDDLVELVLGSGAVPVVVPDWVVDQAGTPEGSWTAFSLWDGTPQGRAAGVAVVDLQGRVRWWHDNDENGGLSVEVGDHELLVGAGGAPARRVADDGRTTWTSPPPSVGVDPHHDVSWDGAGHIVTLTDVDHGEGDAAWLGFGLEVLDPATGQVVWTWDSTTAVARGQLPAGQPGADPYHPNAVEPVVDGDGEGFLISLRALDRIVRLDRTTGDLVWQVGEDLGTALIGDRWFYGQHDVRLHDGLTWMHDNGEDDASRVSRALAVRIDPVADEVEIVWEWTEPGWYEPFFGGIDPLPDGHVLIAQGHCGFCAETAGRSGALIEVDPATDEVVWRLQLPEGMSVYRARRVDGCTLFTSVTACPALGGARDVTSAP